MNFGIDEFPRDGLERQASLCSLEIEGTDYDVSNLLQADELYQPRNFFLGSPLIEMKRSQSCRQTKQEQSLYPRLMASDSSLDPGEDVAEVFKRLSLSRRKSTGMLSHQKEFLIKSKMLLASKVSFQPTQRTLKEGNPEAAEELLARAPKPPRSYSINRMSPSLESVVTSRIDGGYCSTEDGEGKPTSPSSPCLQMSSEKVVRFCRQIEVAPGIVMDLRGADETDEAIGSGVAVSVACPCCCSWMLCVPDAEAVICPDCRVITRLVDNSENAKCSRRHGVGLGFKDDLAN